MKRLPRPIAITLVWYTLAGAFFVPLLMEWHVAPLLPFHWHKALHILGAVLLLGNIAVTGAWGTAARYSGSSETMRFAVRMICWADVFFTGPGFALIVANAAVLASVWGGIYQWSWLVVTLMLLGFFGATGMGALYYQVRLWNLALKPDGVDSPAFHKALRNWGLWGAPATLGPVAILFIMVLKPRFW